ncbi:MAG: methylmalonyl-CoA mutase, partial [Caldilineaceae bacterium]|nr:methylmalonyl-CoA mutase [Caldilineaceae bacterium]
RTQQIIAHESGVADVVDPLGGSYYVEWLTDEIERQAAAYIERIDALGGALAAVDEGFIQREIQDAAYRAQRAVEKNEQIVVGVNAFQTEDAAVEDILRVDEQVQAAQIEALARLRSTRDQAQVDAIRQRIAAAARTPDAPLMPLFVEAVALDVTLGEICDTLREVFGEYMPGNWI